MKDTRTTTTNRNETQKTQTAFAELLRNYERQARTRTPQTETEYTKALIELATACTFSVLKKLCLVGGTVTEQTTNLNDTTKTIRQLRQSIMQDTKNLERLNYTTNNATEYRYNKDGELKRVITDKELYKASNELLDYSLNDGIDLINTAIITILSETAKMTDLSKNFMETPYTVRRLKRKVYIKTADSVNGYETAETTAIQEVYKAVRRDIENSRGLQVASHKYTYLEDIAKDTETETETAIYRRLPKYSGLAYEMTDFNGNITAITADTETVNETDNIIAKMNLTTKQAKILELRQSGHGYKAIATYLGITDSNVKGQIAQIRKKAVAIGLTPTPTK